MPKRIFASIATCVTAGAVLGLTTGPAAADPDAADETPVATYLVNRGDGRCATAAPITDPLAPPAVRLGECAAHESTGQSWYREADGLIVAAGAGRYLEVPRRGVEAGDPVETGIFTGAHMQEWHYDAETGQLSPTDHPDMAVTAGDQLTVQPWTGAATQQWDFPETLSGPAAEPVVDVAASSPPPAPAEPDETLPITGSQPGGIAIFGAAAAATGALALLVVRGRRRLLRGAGYW